MEGESGPRPPRDESPRGEGALAAEDEARVARLRTVTRLMDEAVEIPVLGVRVGLDAVLGLLPGGGDVAGAAISGWTVVTAARLGASPSVVARMLLNVAVDALLGAVPVLGDVFDVAYKSNRRNLRIVEQHVLEPSSTRRRSRLVVWGSVAGVVGVLAGLVAVVAWAASGAWAMLFG